MKKRPPSDAKNDLIARIRHHLETLKLPHILAKLDEYLAWATHESPSPSLLLDHVLGEEATLRRAQRIERRIALSGLKERKTLEAFDWLFQPSLDKGLIIELAGLQFVQRAEDLIITPADAILIARGLDRAESGPRVIRCSAGACPPPG